jgi:hypothetical protein
LFQKKRKRKKVGTLKEALQFITRGSSRLLLAYWLPANKMETSPHGRNRLLDFISLEAMQCMRRDKIITLCEIGEAPKSAARKARAHGKAKAIKYIRAEPLEEDILSFECLFLAQSQGPATGLN